MHMYNTHTHTNIIPSQSILNISLGEQLALYFFIQKCKNTKPYLVLIVILINKHLTSEWTNNKHYQNLTLKLSFHDLSVFR